jgi:hypothetical protein
MTSFFMASMTVIAKSSDLGALSADANEPGRAPGGAGHGVPFQASGQGASGGDVL